MNCKKTAAAAIVALISTSCVTTDKNRPTFKGQEIADCPLDADDGLFVTANGHGFGEAKDIAKDRFTSEFQFPKKLAKLFKPTVKGYCWTEAENDGDQRLIQALYGFDEDSVEKIKDKITDNLRSRKSLSSATTAAEKVNAMEKTVRALNQVNAWNEFVEAVQGTELNVSPIPQSESMAHYAKQVRELDMSVKFEDDELDPMMASILRKSLTGLGFVILNASKTIQKPDLMLRFRITKEPFPKVSDFAFLSLNAMISVEDAEGRVISELNWQVKGGGIDDKQAYTNARGEFAKRLETDFLTTVFGKSVAH